MKGISNTVADYGKLIDETMQIWTSLQKGPNIQRIEEELQAKQKVVVRYPGNYKDPTSTTEARQHH